MNDLSTIQMLFANRMFRVPDYQRGYAWEQPQWQDLIEDLELLPAQRQHYTGTLVLCPAASEPARMDYSGTAHVLHDIVDGQQRLTTIVLLLDAVRRELLAFPARQELAAGIARSFIVVPDLAGRPLAKLRLNRDCHAYFFNDALGQSPSPSGPTILAHERLDGAKTYFAAYMSTQRTRLGSAYEEWLLALHARITQQLVVMVYAVDSMADVGVIFETMNNRGKPISELEKVKNYLLYISSRLNLPADNDLPDVINEAWTHIFEHLAAARLVQSEDEDRLLRAHWLMAYEPVPTLWHGSRSVKQRFDLRHYRDRHPELLADLSAYIDSLRNACTAYCDAYRPTHPAAFGSLEDDGGLRHNVVLVSEKLTRLRAVASFLPLLMAARLAHPEEAQGFLALVQLCEKYAFRVYRWRGLRVSAGMTNLYRLGNSLYAGAPLHETLDALRALLVRYCSEAQFKERFGRETEDWYRWSGITYFLYEYEEYLAASQRLPLRMMWEEVDRRDREDTIEHILPRTPTVGGYWSEHFDAQQRQRYTNDIGNLTLTYHNSELSNRPFPEKRGEAGTGYGYANSAIAMERRLARCTDWNPEAIEARREEIRAWALDRWQVTEAAPLPTDMGHTQPDRVWADLNRDERLAYVSRLAQQRGVTEDYETLLAAASKHGLYLRPYETCVVVVPDKMRKIGLFTIWPQPGRISLGFWAENWFKYFHMPATKAQEAVGMRKYAYLTGERISRFVEGLDQLFAQIAAG